MSCFFLYYCTIVGLKNIALKFLAVYGRCQSKKSALTFREICEEDYSRDVVSNLRLEKKDRLGNW